MSTSARNRPQHPTFLGAESHCLLDGLYNGLGTAVRVEIALESCFKFRHRLHKTHKWTTTSPVLAAQGTVIQYLVALVLLGYSMIGRSRETYRQLTSSWLICSLSIALFLDKVIDPAYSDANARNCVKRQTSFMSEAGTGSAILYTQHQALLACTIYWRVSTRHHSHLLFTRA